MPAFTAVYTPQQREAMAIAVVDRGIKPARRVVELAGRGELTLDGEQLGPFRTNENTVRDCARHLRKRRAGEIRSKNADLPPRDQGDAIQRRLFALCDRELDVLERRKAGTVKAEEIRQIARAAREAMAISTLAGVQPGQRVPGTPQHAGGKTKGGMASEILKAAQNGRVETQPAPQPTPQGTETLTGSATRPDPGVQDATQSSEQQDSPGAWASEHVAVPA